MFERSFSDESLVLQIQMNPDDNLQYVELQRCYAEIERQRALIERAKEFVQFCNESHEDMESWQWLKDAGGGE